MTKHSRETLTAMALTATLVTAIATPATAQATTQATTQATQAPAQATTQATQAPAQATTQATQATTQATQAKAQANTTPQCPSVVTLVARGSEEEETYAPEASNGYSNGYEGETIHRFLDYASATHPDLFAAGERAVMAIDSEHYPARFPVGEAGEDPDPATIVNGIGLFVDSMSRGLPGGIEMVEEYERESGCSPEYVGLGYSQGVAALAPVQHMLAAQGRLRGAVYLGNPFHRAPELIGGGAMSDVPVHSFCLPDDFVCDTGPRAIITALQDDEGAGAHDTYFHDAAANPDAAGPGEQQATDVLAGLVTAAR